MSRVYCPACGDENPADAHYCIACGTVLNHSVTGPTVRLPNAHMQRTSTQQLRSFRALPADWRRIIHHYPFLILIVVALLSVLSVVGLPFGISREPRPPLTRLLPAPLQATPTPIAVVDVPLPTLSPTLSLPIAPLPNPASPQGPRLYVNTGSSISMYDSATGALLTPVASASPTMQGLAGMAIGPDHHLYVSDGEIIRRYHGLTGIYLNTFVDLKQAGFAVAYVLAFGPDGNLYVAGQYDDPPGAYPPFKVLRFDGSTGQYIDKFIPQLPGVVQLSIEAMTFGPDGQLYISCTTAIGLYPRVLRFDGVTGAFSGSFIAENQSPLNNVGFGITFGPDQNLYMVGNGEVLRFDGRTGAFMDVFVGQGSGGLQSATDLAFGPDGNLYVIRQDTDAILRYNGTTGAFMDVFIEPRDDPMLGYNVLVFQPVATDSNRS